jgi:hypothetical protein
VVLGKGLLPDYKAVEEKGGRAEMHMVTQVADYLEAGDNVGIALGNIVVEDDLGMDLHILAGVDIPRLALVEVGKKLLVVVECLDKVVVGLGSCIGGK